jgi:hypothetical protein
MDRFQKTHFLLFAGSNPLGEEIDLFCNLSSRKILTYKIDITKVEDITEEFRVWINGSDSGRILG